MRLSYQDSDVWVQSDFTPSSYPTFGDPHSGFFAVHRVDRRDAEEPLGN
jgi:hypothetical protein